ncbi:protein split ends-like isoform X2 [Formica exsecta]|uniref:protein split ends-like isoform X2 n=1 Tax=Formica exsecta TaxID=72781 RepID=UPI0011423DE7|nr:protein split ends-like isoform X2 [Formica exsecta]
MLRYIHSYPPTSVSAPAVAAVVTTAPSPAAPVPIPAPAPAPPPSQPTVIASQTPPPPLTGTAYTARDAYRASTTNVNERIAISVSNSPLSQVGVGVVAEYSGMGTGGRGDRPRISLLPPTGSSVTPIPSPTAVAASEYQQHAAAARNPPRVGLMPVQPDQYCTRTAIDMASLQQDTPPFKKIRLGQPHQQVQQLQSQSQSRCQSLSPADPCGGKQEQQQQQQHVVQLQQPLRIDTRPAVGAYTPQTEAISPTLPEPNTQEDALRSTKDELLQQIGKVDREIAKRENQLNMLRKRIKELEEAANKPLEAGGLKRNIEEQSQQPKHQSLAQKIYAENRRKAEEAHRLMEKLGPKIELPLYNQPSDTSVYQENRTRHQTCMRTRLIARLRRDHTERASLHQQQTQTYTILVQEWHRKVERLEATQKRKSKETKNREFFEKVFPELRKQREDKERFNRVGARIKSEADLEEIMDGLQEQEEETLQDLKNFIKAYQLEDKKMRSYAVIPPLLLDAKQRRIAFQNRNGLLQPEELEALHSERKLINVWSSVEHESFKEKYLQHPKNYGVIAQSLEHKGVQDCVHHYYLTKKTENYKQLLRKSRQRTRSSRNNPNNKVNNTNSTIGSIDILTTGVTTRLQREQQKTQENPIDILTAGITTRLQREQQQKTQENPQNSSVTATTTSTTSTTVTSSVSSTTVTTTTVTTTTTPLSSTASGVSVTADSVTASTTTTTTSVLNTTASSVSATSTTSSAKDSRETSKENKENKTDSKESHLVKMDSKDEAQLEMGKDIKVIMEGKGALSSSASSLNINATNVSTIQSDFKESSKKKPGCRDTSGSGANVATSSRIKDKKKENHTPMETSDEEAPSIDIIESGRQIGPHACTVCQSVVEGSAHSRALPRSQASQYGLREDQVPVGARVCNTCRCKAVRGRYTTCPLPGCPNLNSSKSRIKRLRALPSKWLDLPLEIREPIAQEFQIPNNATKCCSACFSRISRRLAPHLTGGTEASEDGADAMLRQWTDEELEQLRKALREYGTNWPKIAEQIPGKTSQQCKNYYFAYRKKLTLDQVVSEYYTLLGEERRPPYVTDEEESGSSTSSCDELAVHDSSDTASAGSPATTTMTGSNAAVIPSSGPTATSSSLSFQRPSELGSLEKLGEKISDITVVSLVPPAGSSHQSSSGGAAVTSGGAREDYDSSATETADEGQGGADLDNGSVVVTMTASGNATSLQQQSQHQQPPPATAHSPPSTTSNSNPLTVKDLMLGVIEMQLKRTPNSPADNGGSSAPNSSGTPTISSILKTDHRNDITYVRGYKPSSSMTNTALPNRDTNLATLSVVSGPHHGHRSAPSPQQIGQMQATITPCPPAAPNSQASSSDLLPKEGLVVMQVQQALRETEGTLDLSIKKPRLQQDYNHSIQIHKPPTVTLYRPEPPPGAYYHPHTTPHPEQGRNAKSPLVYASTPRPQASITPKMNKVTVPQTHPKLSPKLSSMSTPGHKGGSITHGTPVSTARYEGLLRQMTPPGNPPVSGASANVSERGGGVVNASSAGPGAPKETGGGSITQGTPVLPFAVDKRGAPIYDYHRTIRHSPVTGSGNVPPPPPGQGPASQSASPAVVVSHGGSQYNSYSAAGRPPPSYTMEQQLSSRQIIMNDYITSQQMHARARGSGSAGASVTGEMAGKSEPPPPPSSTLYYASTPPPPPPQTHTQPRQGVIQRHNTQKQMHYPPQPPIMDAFSNLVEVAIKQPTLPVPHPHGHPTASGSGGHEGLGKTMADRLLADRYDNNRAFREQEIRMQEHRMAEHRLAQQHQRERERERDIVHLREKEEHRLHREKELQQLEHRLAVQQHHQHREKDFQQQEHRLASQREKDMHVEHTRLQIREKDISHEHRLIHQQREKEIHQQMAAAAQREKEHEHRLAVQQREKEIQHQEQRLAIQQQRENPHVVGSPIQQHAEHRLAVQQAHRERDLVHLHQQQQQQQQIQQHIQQQRIEIERRHMAQLFRDQQQQQQQLDRDSSRLLSSGFSQSSRLQQSQQSQQQQQQQQSSSRQNQSSNQQQNDSSSTLTAASLIDAIITHQINQGVDNASASGSSTNQPTRAGDRLFQGFHRETPQEPNGIAHSPAGEGSGGGASGNGSGCSKAMTLGEHVEHIISKDYGPPHSSYRPYGYPISEDQWKRRKHNEPDSVKTGDERQIIRVAQQQQQQQQTQQQQQQTQQHQSSGKQQYHSVEPLSPPETTANHYGRRFYEPSTATSTSGTPSNKPHQISPFDYVKNKIVEVMRTEDDKAGGCGGSSGGDNGAGSDRNGGGNTVVTTEKDEKGAGSVDRSPSGNGGSGSGGGEMVIDDTGGSTREQPPPPPPAPAATTTFYPFSALGVHTGPPPAPPPASATSASVTKSEQMQAEPAPLLSAQYEPLSDED